MGLLQSGIHKGISLGETGKLLQNIFIRIIVIAVMESHSILSAYQYPCNITSSPRLLPDRIVSSWAHWVGSSSWTI